MLQSFLFFLILFNILYYYYLVLKKITVSVVYPRKMSSANKSIEINLDDYYKLISAKIVLDVLNKSIKQLNKIKLSQSHMGNELMQIKINVMV